MIGSLNTARKEVTIVGAGVAGLLAAHYLDKKGYRVTLHEAAGRAGGLIRTVGCDFGIAESGAHSVLATETVQSLAEELGIELAPVHKESKARYILRDGKLRKFPLKAHEAVSALFRGYFVLADRGADPMRVSLERWAARFLGTPALQYLFTPFVRGVYGAEPKDITIGAAFPALAVPRGHSLFSFFLGKVLRAPFSKGNKSAPSGGKPKRKKQMMSPAKGMGSLVEALEQSLENRLGDRFFRNSRIQTLPEAPNLIIAVPTDVASQLLETADPQLSAALRSVPYTPMVSVTAFVERSAMTRDIRGVGVLSPALEGRDALGILFNSSCFPNRVVDDAKLASFTLMMGGSAHPEWLAADDDRIKGAVDHELRDLLGVNGGAAHIVIHRWKRAIPQYGTALQDAWDAAREGWCATPGRILFGNYSGQVSLRGMIESAASL